jgi:hypothetical protein
VSVASVSSLYLLTILFRNLDEYHKKQLDDLKEYYEKSINTHDGYVKKAQSSMDTMGDNYDYHDYDYGEEQELARETLAAESSLKLYNETASQQLLSIYEMKVLYLYKEVEIRLKIIISNRYDKSTKNLSSLTLISDYFTEKGVILKDIEGYADVEALRLVSNDLKHSIKINKSRDLDEFSDLSEFNFESLEKFMLNKLYKVERFLADVVRVTYGGYLESNSDIPF